MQVEMLKSHRPVLREKWRASESNFIISAVAASCHLETQLQRFEKDVKMSTGKISNDSLVDSNS